MANQKRDAIYYSIIALMTFLPSNTTFNLLRTVIVAVMFFMTNPGGIRKLSLGDRDSSRIVTLIIVSPLFSFAVVFLLSFGNASVSLFIHEFVRMIFNVLVILTVRRLTVTYRHCYKIAIIVLFVNFVIQFLEYSGNEMIFDILEKYYLGDVTEGEWTHLDLVHEGANARYGSIYINPNVYLIIPMLTLGIILYMDRKKSSFLNYIFLIITFLSCILTGSRTSIIVMAVIIAVYFLKFSSAKKAIALIMVAIVGIVFYLANYGDVGRAFDIGSLASLTTKFQLFYWYWQTANPLYWLTGSIGAAVSGIDSEIGHIYAWYGVLGIYWYILLVKYIAKVNKDRFISMVSVLSFVLVGITSSVFLNFPVVTFFISMVLANKIDEGALKITSKEEGQL